MLSDYIHKLNIDIQTLLYSFNRETNQYEPKTFNDTKFITKIGLNNNIDALACYLILLREMEIKKNWQLYVEIKWNLYQLLIRLTNFSPWLHIKKELCSLIHQYFMSNNDPITINYFPSFIQKVIPDYMHIYKSPPPIINCIDGQDYFYALIERALAEKLINNKKEEKLDFLFWAMQLGLNDIYLALTSTTHNPSEIPIIQSLTKAMKSRYKGKYLKSSVIMPF